MPTWLYSRTPVPTENSVWSAKTRSDFEINKLWRFCVTHCYMRGFRSENTEAIREFFVGTAYAIIADYRYVEAILGGRLPADCALFQLPYGP